MKHLLLTTIAALLVVGCGESQQSAPQSEPVEPIAEAAKPKPPTAKAPDISIHDAAEKGNIEAVKQHLAAGADVNAKDGDGFTPLDVAIQFKKAEAADLLRKHGGKYGSIQFAAAGGDTEALKEFLAAGADVNAKNKYGSTPLRYAAGNGHKEVHELLITKGADVNAKAGDGTTPLHNAAVYGHNEIAELLIANGANVNAKEVDGLTPLDFAIMSNQPEIADLLRKHSGKTKKELEAAGN